MSCLPTPSSPSEHLPPLSSSPLPLPVLDGNVRDRRKEHERRIFQLGGFWIPPLHKTYLARLYTRTSWYKFYVNTTHGLLSRNFLGRSSSSCCILVRCSTEPAIALSMAYLVLKRYSNQYYSMISNRCVQSPTDMQS